MANIAQYLAAIMNAVYGEEVRGSIHDAIEAINNDVGTSNTQSANAVSTANAANTKSDNAVSTANAANTKSDNAVSIANAANAVAQKFDNLTADATNVPTGTTGNLVTVSESDGHKVFSFKIPKGKVPSFSVGTVSTLAVDQPATVTITGTDEAPVLNLGLPRGERGPAGTMQNASGESIRMYESSATDDTIAEHIDALGDKVTDSTKVISFTNLSFASSGSSYAAMIEDSSILATMKPGALFLTNNAAQNGSLSIQTYDGYVTFTMSGAPLAAFSGEVLLHKVG